MRSCYMYEWVMWAQVWDGHLESRKNPDRLKRNIHVDCIGVHSSEAKIAFITARKEIME